MSVNIIVSQPILFVEFLLFIFRYSAKSMEFVFLIAAVSLKEQMILLLPDLFLFSVDVCGNDEEIRKESSQSRRERLVDNYSIYFSALI